MSGFPSLPPKPDQPEATRCNQSDSRKSSLRSSQAVPVPTRSPSRRLDLKSNSVPDASHRQPPKYLRNVAIILPDGRRQRISWRLLIARARPLRFIQVAAAYSRHDQSPADGPARDAAHSVPVRTGAPPREVAPENRADPVRSGAAPRGVAPENRAAPARTAGDAARSDGRVLAGVSRQSHHGLRAR